MELTLNEKIGQLVVSRLDLHPEKKDLALAEYLIREFHIGGFIVFGGDVEYVAETLNHLQGISQYPLLFSADLERGLGQQIAGGTSFPYFMGLAEAAKRDSVQLIYDAAKITAIESRAIGIHQNFSPVLDINSNRANPIINIRSFGEDAETVTSCSRAYVRGLQESGMLATGKHFPGHGDTATDSHSELPTLHFSAKEIDQREFLPFQDAVHAGVDAIMVGHIAVPSLDPSGLPASMSKIIVSHLLRQKWNYNGLIITDAMMMGAITNNFSEDEAITRVFEAGADQILMPVNVETAYRTIKDIVTNKPELILRLDQSVQRIIHAKQRLGLFESRFVDPTKVKTIVGCLEHNALAEAVARKCFMVKKGGWPHEIHGDNAEIWLIKTDRKSFSMIRSAGGLKIIESELSDEIVSIPEFDPTKKLIVITDLKPMAWQEKNILSEEIESVMMREFKTKKHLLIACGNPFIADHLGFVRNFVCTFNTGNAAQEEILKRLK